LLLLYTCARAMASCRFARTSSHDFSGFVLAFEYFSTLLHTCILTPRLQFYYSRIMQATVHCTALTSDLF